MNLNEQIQVHMRNETVFEKLGLLSVLFSRECNGISGTAKLLPNSGEIAFETSACKKMFFLDVQINLLLGVQGYKKMFFFK